MTHDYLWYLVISCYNYQIFIPMEVYDTRPHPTRIYDIPNLGNIGHSNKQKLYIC